MSDDGRKTTVTFPTLPKMTNVALIPVLGPFGGISSLLQRTHLIPKLERRADAIAVMVIFSLFRFPYREEAM